MCLLFPSDSPLSLNPSSFSSQLLECITNGTATCPKWLIGKHWRKLGLEIPAGWWIAQHGRSLHLSLAKCLSHLIFSSEALMTTGLYIPGQTCLLHWHRGQNTVEKALLKDWGQGPCPASKKAFGEPGNPYRALDLSQSHQKIQTDMFARKRCPLWSAFMPLVEGGETCGRKWSERGETQMEWQ